MDGKSKTRKSRNGISLTTNSSARCFDYHNMIRSSKRIGEAKISCCGCKQEFIVPATTTSYRCHRCKDVTDSVSGDYHNYKKSTENKMLKHDQLDTNNEGSSSSFSTRNTTTTGNKRAVLCGVTYNRRQFKLSGTINDVINMKDLLLNKFQFPLHSIRVLTEEEKDPDLIPTKKNIMESLKWLVRDCKSGDSLVFYFSGHGLQQPANPKEDEIDGRDEIICPVDFIKEGMITDNEINSTIVGPLKKGVKLHAIVDACHSGSALDLVYVYKKHIGNWKWVDNKPPSKKPITKSTSGGVAICLSACEDSQMAADTSAFGGKDQMNGAMTYLLANTIRKHSEITYADLLQKMHDGIDMIQQRKYCNGFLKCMFHRKVEQDPLLSSSEKFDVYTRISF